jgi:hypothetical protein
VAGLTQLEYYKDLKLPHNIDLMHIEKNVPETVFNTLLNIAEKTKDNIKVRVDVQNLCDRKRLHMQPPKGNQKIGSSRMPTTALIVSKRSRHLSDSNTS